MRFSKHLRRLHARWRLHRMEWEAMHRPLEPPPGYERFHTDEAAFPGLRKPANSPKTWSEYRDAWRRAWKLYRHSYIPDDDITAAEQKEEAIRQKIFERKADILLGKGKKAAEDGFKVSQDTADDIARGLRDKKPEAEALLKDRVSILSKALNEFSEGYREGARGDFSIWETSDDEEEEYSEDIIRQDNRPLAYIVEQQTGPSEDFGKGES